MPEYTVPQLNERIKADPEMTQLYKDDVNAFEEKANAIYHRFGYRPDGTSLPSAQKAFGTASRATGIPEGVIQGVAAASLPIAGAALGMAAGSAGGPAGTAVGAMGGSVLGAAGNSLLGITDPMSPVDMGIEAASPLAGLGVGHAVPGLIKGAKRVIPGMGAGLNEYAAERLAKVMSGMRVTKDDVDATRTIIGNVSDFKIDIPLTRALFQSESGDIARQAAQDIPDTKTYLKELNAQIGNLGKKGPVSFKTLMTLEQGFNRIKGGRPDELWAAASGKIIDDMEAQLANPKLSQGSTKKISDGLTAFKTFIATNRRYQADETLVSMFQRGGKVVKEVQGDSSMVKFDQRAFKTQLDTNAVLKKTLTPTEINSIKESVAEIGYISSPPETGGDVLSLGKRYGAGGIIGGAIGYMVGGSAMIGAPVGMAVEEVMRKAVSSESGRSVVKYLAKKGRGHIQLLELNTMLGKITAGASAAIPGVTGAGSPEGNQPFLNQE